MKNVAYISLLSVVLLIGCVASDIQSDSSERIVSEPTEQLLKDFLEAFNRHDLDSIMEFFSEDCELIMPRGPDPWGGLMVGRVAVREGLASRFEGIPDVHYGDDRHFVSGNRGASEWLLTGTTPSGEKIEVRGVDLLEFRDGKIIRKDSYWKIVE